jgi:hypothetical protein
MSYEADMSNIRSEALKRGRSAGASGAVSVVGVLLLLVSVGPLFLLLNGGYSIVGMAWLAAHTGEYGRLFWALATFWTVDVPIVQRAGLPLAQPVLPWAMVLGISFLQIGLFIRRLQGKPIEPLLDSCGLAVSAFDFATTAIGMMFAPFTAGLGALRYVWMILAIGLAVPITFGFEGVLARALRGR